MFRVVNSGHTNKNRTIFSFADRMHGVPDIARIFLAILLDQLRIGIAIRHHATARFWLAQKIIAAVEIAVGTEPLAGVVPKFPFKRRAASQQDRGAVVGAR